MRNEAKELIGINKNVSSKINLILENNAVETITFSTKLTEIFSRKKLPENARKLRGLVWRGNERIRRRICFQMKKTNSMTK
jgi:DNA-directed RNA polymerase